MALLEVLTPNERKLFDLPPQFLSIDDRENYFKLDEALTNIVDGLRGTVNKVGFILQLGYFRWLGKFYLPKDFHKKDLSFIISRLKFSEKANMKDYSKSSYNRHQELILEYLGCAKFDKNVFIQEIERLANKYTRPKQMLMAIIETFKKLKIEVPGYNVFAEAITAEYNKAEKNVLEKIENQLTKKQIKELNDLLPSNEDDPKNPTYKRSVLTGLRNIRQSLKPKDIKFDGQNFIKIKALYNELKPIIDSLTLSKEAVHYYATWIFKAKIAQVVQFSSIYKKALYIMSFIAYQHSVFHDIFVDILLRSTQKALNDIKKQQKDNDFEDRAERNNSIKLMAEDRKKSRNALSDVKKIVFSPALTDKNKVKEIQVVIIKDQDEQNVSYEEKFNLLEQETENALKGQDFFDIMEKKSKKLQLRVSDIIKQLIFNSSNSDQNIIEAINYYKKVDGKIDNKSPILFLDKNSIEYLYDSKGNIKTSLYKALLFINIAEAIKSGNLNLLYSYRYLSVDEYFIDRKRWENEKTLLLARAGMTDLLDFNKIIKKYKKAINDKFEVTNQNILNNKNPYIKFKEDGSFIVKTPIVDKPDTAKISTLFNDNQYTPIVQLLEAVNNITGFVDCFKHFMIKYNKEKPSVSTFIAGIIALGCNIGTRKMANISIGISESTLITACNWYFSLDNINNANNQIVSLINRLSLPNMFIREKYSLHTSGDAKKIVVNADSLNANSSFKYYGKDRGASVYTFIDERHVLFHSLVFSSSEREAGYVVDGLLCNEEIKADIFSTDTHGFTEIVFAVFELLGISFAPRIKKSQKQLLYSFNGKREYSKKGYKILPHKRINEKIIKDNWDDILRLMVTIKLKETTASQILKRLSSYANEHPLYKALKEFGRIIKTVFLLTYFDDVILRQRIQKQLNKVELSNKFSDAVFFDNNQEFSQVTKEDQEIATSCKRLTQNAIILWNYLYLSKLLTECKDPIEKDNMIKIIVNGSIIFWKRINFFGEYNFSEKPINDDSFSFDLEKILELELKVA